MDPTGVTSLSAAPTPAAPWLKPTPGAAAPVTPADVELENIRRLFDAFRDPIAILRGPKLTFTYVNAAHVRFHGADFTDTALAEARATLVAGPGPDAVEHVARTGETIFLDELEYRCADKISYFNATYTPWRAADGSVDGVLVLCVDVTPTVVARRAAQQARKDIHDLFMRAPVGIAVMEGPEHVVSLVNATFQKVIFGNESSDCIGKPIREAIPGVVDRSRFQVLDEVYRTGATVIRNEQPVDLAEPDGTVRTIFINYIIQARREPLGRVEGLVGVVIDVTEQTLAKQRTEHALRTRDSFLSIASHELRTPLTGMLLRNEILRRDLQRGKAEAPTLDNVRRWIEQNNHGLRRMDRLVADMLDASRLQLGDTVLECQNVDVVPILRAALESFQPELQAARIDVTLECPESLELHVDAFRLEQIFSNFFTNAVRYAPGAPLRITVEADAHAARFCFRDGGPGIPAEFRERIFRRFERLVPADDVSGLGLGLYIVRELVEAHGGRTWAESEPGAGSSFCVELPRPREGHDGHS